MSDWQNVLKSRTRPRDIKDLGVIYALPDVYESKLLSEEEYNRLPDKHSGRPKGSQAVSKLHYHNILYNLLDGNRDSPSYSELSKNRTFHRTMQQRLIRGNPTNKATFPTIELFEEKGSYNKGRPKGAKNAPKMSRMLINLFTFSGIKTKEEVEDIIGRKLTPDETYSYERVVEEYGDKK